VSKVLENLKYSKSHEWVRLEGNVAFIGISDYAQKSLGTLVYVEASDIGDEVTQFESFGAVESVKSASDINSPVSGTIIDINEDVIDNPELVNTNSYENWIIKVEISDESELDSLLDATSYQKIYNV